MKNSSFGWVDFNKTDRERALQLIEDNKDQGSVDELGLGVVRDEFANIFFPGITTIQTRARYFLLVPYWMKKIALELKNNESNISKYEDVYFKNEKDKSKLLLEHSNNKDGILGSTVLDSKKWLVRTIVETYWTGLWEYGLIKNRRNFKRLPFSRCVKLLLEQNKNRVETEGDDKYSKMGNTDDVANNEIIAINNEVYMLERRLEEERYYNIDLNREEARLLYELIKNNVPEESLLHVAIDDAVPFSQIDDFSKIDENHYPLIRDKIILAKEFKKLAAFLGKRFSHLIGRKVIGFEDYPSINMATINDIFETIPSLSKRTKLKLFITDATKLIIDKNGEELDKLICKREMSLKHSRAKTLLYQGVTDSEEAPISFDYDYRLGKAKELIKDIKHGLGEQL